MRHLNSVNPNLVEERRKVNFDMKTFSNLLYGPRLFPKLAKLRQIFSHNKNLDLEYMWNTSGPARYEKACALAEYMVEIIRENKLTEDDDFVGALQVMCGDDMFLLLHLTMFLGALQSLSSDEQAKKWVPLARDFRILGTYAQTELAHGSNVPGLETTATLDLKTDEWVLNTPSLQSYKWWVGGLGKSCTHCVIMARLIIRDKDYGVHPFFLQLRCLSTHRSLPGITLLHIGQKMGYNSMDNGGMCLKNVRIPRTNLLMRYYSVDKDGNYHLTGDKKMLYSTLTFTRKQIVLAAGVYLARSAVIAIRYSAVRRQFLPLKKGGTKDSSNKPLEEKVLDYVNVQRTLFSVLAMSVAFIFTSRGVEEAYEEFQAACKRRNFSLLDDIHCTTSSLKAYLTLVIADGIEKCRRSCGGHGYMLASGVSSHYLNFLPQATYEGDFAILSIQVGRVLLKVLQRKVQGIETSSSCMGSFHYIPKKFEILNEQEIQLGLWLEDFKKTDILIKAFQARAIKLLFAACESLGMSPDPEKLMENFEETKPALMRLTVAHAQQVVIVEFLKGINQIYSKGNGCSKEIQIFELLLRGVALHWISEYLVEFIVTGCFDKVNISSEYSDELKNKMEFISKRIDKCIADFCVELRPQAVAISDSFRLDDRFLNSAIGRYDGRAYEALLESTKSEPLNESDVASAYEKHIKYILHPELKRTNSKL